MAVALALSVASCRRALADAQLARQDAAIAREHVAALERARRVDAAAVDRALSERDLLRKIEGEKRAETEKALTKHQDWAEQPVPADVLVSLRE